MEPRDQRKSESRVAVEAVELAAVCQETVGFLFAWLVSSRAIGGPRDGSPKTHLRGLHLDHFLAHDVFSLGDHRDAVRVRILGVEVLRRPRVVGSLAVEILPHRALHEFQTSRTFVHDARDEVNDACVERECARGALRDPGEQRCASSVGRAARSDGRGMSASFITQRNVWAPVWAPVWFQPVTRSKRRISSPVDSRLDDARTPTERNFLESRLH